MDNDMLEQLEAIALHLTERFPCLAYENDDGSCNFRAPVRHTERFGSTITIFHLKMRETTLILSLGPVIDIMKSHGTDRTLDKFDLNDPSSVATLEQSVIEILEANFLKGCI